MLLTVGVLKNLSLAQPVKSQFERLIPTYSCLETTQIIINQLLKLEFYAGFTPFWAGILSGSGIYLNQWVRYYFLLQISHSLQN